MRQDFQGRNAGDGGAAGVVQHGLDVLAGTKPIALLEAHSSTAGHHIEPPGIEVACFAICQPLSLVTSRLLVLTTRYRTGTEARVGTCCFLLRVTSQGHFETALEIGPARGVAADEANEAECAQGMSDNLLIGLWLSQLQSFLRPVNSGLGGMRLHVEMGNVSVRHCQFGTRGQRLEYRDGVSAVLSRRLPVTGKPGEPRKPAQCVAFLQQSIQRAPDLERPPARIDG